MRFWLLLLHLFPYSKQWLVHSYDGNMYLMCCISLATIFIALWTMAVENATYTNNSRRPISKSVGLQDVLSMISNHLFFSISNAIVFSQSFSFFSEAGTTVTSWPWPCTNSNTNWIVCSDARSNSEYSAGKGALDWGCQPHQLWIICFSIWKVRRSYYVHSVHRHYLLELLVISTLFYRRYIIHVERVYQ